MQSNEVAEEMWGLVELCGLRGICLLTLYFVTPLTFILMVSFTRVSEYLYMFMLGVSLYLMCLHVVHCE